MESVRDDAMAQAILGALRKGPLSESGLLGLFQRNRKAEEIHGIVARLRQAKQIDTVADGLYLLACEDHELAGFIEHNSLFRTGQIREVPRALMEAA